MTGPTPTTTPEPRATFELALPAPLREELFLDLRLWQAVALPLLLLVALVLGWVAAAMVRRAVRPAVARTGATLDDTPILAMRRPLLLVFTVIFVAAGLPMLALPEPLDGFLRGLLKGLGVVVVSWTALRLLDVFMLAAGRRFEREGRRRAAALVPLGRGAAKIFLAAIAVVVLLQNIGLDVTGLIAGLGVGGIAVALAAQKTIENVFGGVSVITDEPVRVGDFCQFRDGRVGTVEEIGLRSTRIRTPDRTLITIPNADFAQRELENLTARNCMRLYTVVGLRAETTPDQLRAVVETLRQILTSHPLVSAEMLRVYFVGFGANSLDVEINAYLETTDVDEFGTAREEIFLRMMEAIEASGTALARAVQPAPVAAPPPARKT